MLGAGKYTVGLPARLDDFKEARLAAERVVFGRRAQAWRRGEVRGEERRGQERGWERSGERTGG